ncbi:MAG TPA: NADH-quinone oxidoreductase subunit NuoH [Ilumatobacteraceae bacterium]|nr:NADH-quinone oxidoreductase subunit NuoH [Ilumatobacteraceae bacterium]
MNAILALDLLPQDITLGDVAIILLKVVLIFVVGLVGTMMMVWFERKVISGMQNRIGPNKAGPVGLLQTLADGTKLFFKEALTPARSDKLVYRLAPFLAFVPAFLVWSVIPLGGDFTNRRDGSFELFGHRTFAQLADPSIGILLALAMSSIAVYGIMLAGWSSGSKYPLLGSVRATAQMISYEAALGLSLACVILVSGTLSTRGIVLNQWTTGRWHLIATGLLPLVVFFIAATAELNRPPFDLVEAESELVSGFNTEYSGISFALFYLAEFMNVITMSGIIVTLFLGGPQPLTVNIGSLEWDGSFGLGALNGTIWFLLKVLVFLYIFVWLRGTLPRLRYDQLMNLGWKILIPISLAWFMLLAAFRIGEDRGWNRVVVGAVGLGVILVAGALLTMANNVATRNRQREGVMF